MEGRGLSREAITNEEVQCPTLLELTQKYSVEKGSSNTTEFSKSVVFKSKQILFVKNNTIQQSQSDYWFSHRKGRIIASKFYRVFTRSKTLQKIEESNGRVNASSALVSEIMCYRPKVKTFAMKHSLSTQQHGKKRYAIISKKTNKDWKISDSGLVMYEKLPYIATSPDLEVVCKFCGAGLVEIKCPLNRNPYRR